MIRLLAFLFLALPCLAFADDEPKTPKAKKPEGPLAEARQRWLRGNYDEARAAYEKLLDDEKLRGRAAIGIARSWQSVGDDAKALEVIEAALKKDDKDPNLLAARADLLFDLGRWDEASKDAAAAIKLKPDQFLAHWVGARLIRDTGDVKKADTEMRWFVRTYTQRENADKPITDPDDLLLVGLAGAENARWHSLSDQFRFLINDLYPDVLKYDPDDCRAEWHIGMLLLEKYNRPEANQAFDNALKINPNAAEAHVGKGLVALQQFETKDADTHADHALKVNPRLPSALRLKSDLLMLAGDLGGARKLLEKAKEVRPREETTLARLAACARVQNKSDDVKAIIAEVEKFNPKPGLFYAELASSLEDRKIYGDAEVYFQKSIELRDQLATAKTGLGMLYLRLGKEKEARVLLEQAFKGDTFNVRVSNSLKVLRHLEKYETITTPHYDLRYDPIAKVVVWEVATGSIRHEFAAGDGSITALAFSRDGRALAAGCSDTTILLWDLAPKADRTESLAAGDLDGLWKTLEGTDAKKAEEALRTLAARPAEAVPFLNEQLKPVPVATTDAAKMQKMIADLDSPRYAVREAAMRDLERLGHLAREPVQEALKKTSITPEVRERLEKLSDAVNKPDTGAEWVRPLRAVEALERIGTPDAVAHLKELAAGGDAPPTRVAKEALGRLGVK
jgi:tetratricopeptide (TPR) repeat protein